jgi:ATP-dependent Clp protease ATP-binding subunit ClpA
LSTFSRHLQDTLHRAVGYANARRHEYATLEHLLLALVDDPEASEVMRACKVDLAQLKKSLTSYVDTELTSLVVDHGQDAMPAADFQRVIHRAVIHVKSSGRDEVTGANVLVAVFAEQESRAAWFLQKQKMTRHDAVNFIIHGASKKRRWSIPFGAPRKKREDFPSATFSLHLEETLRRAIGYAKARRHAYATLEHLLLALVDDPEASEVMRACNVDLAQLKNSLTTYVDTELTSLVVDDGEDAMPTAGFQRVIQRAVIHVKASGRGEVTGANVLVAVFAEHESHAAHFLQAQKMTRHDAVDFIAHGIAKKPDAS